MSRHKGDYDPAAVIYGKFTTYRPSTGAPFTLAGSPVLSVYKDNSTTQSTAGVTLTVDFDSVTGLHHFAIDTSADGTFYAAGSFFEIVITTGTVDSVSAVGTVVGSFTIRKTSSLKPATAGRTIDLDSGGSITIQFGINQGQMKTSSGYGYAFSGAAGTPGDMSVLTQANIRTATGLASANLDTQLAAANTALVLANKLLKADRVIDTGVTPWALVLIEQGTGALGVGTELLRQDLKDTSGANVTLATQVIGSSRDT